MSAGISEKYKYINSLVELKEERLKNCEQALSAAQILYEDYKGAVKQDARVIESLIKEIADCKKAIKDLKEEIWVLITDANRTLRK